jgi:predicted dehydrogenase/threonine dehydrogenase-like Zn-dependent dehydrogenase
VKQILQSARSGELQLVDVPAPGAERGQVLVQNHFSVVSPGTEKLAMDFARKSLLGKARSRPDLVNQVMRKVRQEGPLPTYRTVVNRLDSPQPLGYSCAGIVVGVGEGVCEFTVGDRVACAGAGYANHAEFVSVPENLVAHVPDGLPLERAAFSTLGAIALQGIRIADPNLGEIAVVVGLGLIGQLAVQLLAANGCRVLGIDIDERRTKQALEQGAEWAATPDTLPADWRDSATGGYGVDFALITASSETAAPIQLSADLCRPKARIVVVGAMPLELDRRSFYEKELELRLSMSYGPGRYDRHYEESGLDYPLPYVRWTENRNLQAVLALAENEAIHPEEIDVEIVDFGEAEEAYAQLAKGQRRSLAILFRYDTGGTPTRSLSIGKARPQPTGRSHVGIGFLGAGNYAKAVLLPNLGDNAGISKRSLVTATGSSARRSAERFGFERCGTDPQEIIKAEDVDLVFIATRHDLHAENAARALGAGKSVWLEKPIGLTPDEVKQVAAAAAGSGAGLLAVGYNRRFSSHARRIRETFENRDGPVHVQYTVSAGGMPRGTWITDPREGGGRIIGEVCHFVDLSSFLIGLEPVRVFAQSISDDRMLDDSMTASIRYSDGSVADIQYLARASAELPKERFEVSGGGITATCDNFKQTRIHGVGPSSGIKNVNQDKGQARAVREVIEAVRKGKASPFTLSELLNTSQVTFGILESIASGQPVAIERD